MTNKKWSRLFGVLVIIFAVVIPLVVVLTYYLSFEPVDPDTNTTRIAISTIGYVLLVGIFFGLVKLVKKRIRVRKEMGLPISPYVILASNNTFGLLVFIVFVAFINAIKGEISTLAYVLDIIKYSLIIAYGLKFAQTHFDIKMLEENE